MPRPTAITTEIAAEFCERIAAGHSIKTVCISSDMPTRRTIWAWLRDDDEFRRLYDRAVEERAEAIFEEALEIADDDGGDYIQTDKGLQFDGQNVKRSALRVETRFKFLAKLLPQRYGDKPATTNITLQLGDIVEESMRLVNPRRDGERTGTLIEAAPASTVDG